jgi:uncharacterized membrane protein YccC
MQMPADLLSRAGDRMRTRDPEGYSLRRAVRAAIVVPLAAAVSYLVVGGSQAPLFTLIGAFWFMVLVDFPGNRQNRALAYCGLGFNGAVLIALGTLVAPIPWLAVTLMFVLGVAVTLAGVLSSTIAAGQRATLLTYILPVCTPVGSISERLLGWAIALAICVPAALFLLAPRHFSELRRHAAQVCTALADRLEGQGSEPDVSAAMDALSANFLAANFRPVGLSAGSRALVRVIDDLQWITDRVGEGTGAALGAMKEPAVEVLQCCARVLDVARVAVRAGDRAELDVALRRLRAVARGQYREDLGVVLGEHDDAAAIVAGRGLLTRRTIATTIGLTGRTIATAAAADARPVWARALGRRLPPSGAADRLLPETVAARTIPRGYLATRSVAARNALRTGVGLALAVAATYLLPVQHGFWVVLGAIVVLGSSALSTRTNVVQAVVGSAVGVTLGAMLIALIGAERPVLLMLLPIGVFGSAYVSRVGSFAAGQATITMTVLIMLNLIAPMGWQFGLVRIEDVTVGAGIAVMVSLLLWPRGAKASVFAAIDAALDVGSRYLQSAVLRITRGSSAETDNVVTTLSHEALVAGRTVDDAVRHYLSETGGDADARTPVVRSANRAIRLRGTADVIADITPPSQLSVYTRARAVLEAHAESVSERLTGVSTKTWPAVSDDLVLALRAECTSDKAAVDAALPLVAVAANLGELELIYPTSTDTSGVGS